jgi:hypothetical protein
MMIEYTEDCCFNYQRDNCKGRNCPCACHVAIPASKPSCGHEEEIERYRARSRAEDTARIRLNPERIALRDAITQALYDYDHGDELGAIVRLRAAVK